MAMRLLLILASAVVPIGQWVIITPGNEVNPAEINRWVEVLEKAGNAVDYFLNPPNSVHAAFKLDGVLRVRVAPSSGDFAAWTGCSIWQGATVRGGELITQPLSVLERRGVTEEVIVHEYVHLVLEPYNVPLWLNEGLAVLCSGQVRRLGGEKGLPTDVNEIEGLLLSGDTTDLRRGYLAAAALVSETIKTVGRDSLTRLIKEEAL